MNKKIKKVSIILILLITTCVCVVLGLKTRYEAGILVTQFAPQTERETMGYMLKTNENNIIMIDGGTIGDAEHVKSAIKENGGNVKIWYLTHAHDDNFGTLLSILNDENSGIVVENIFLNLNSEEWYQKNDSENYENYAIKELFETLDKYEVKSKIHILENREETIVDNLMFKILKVATPEITENAGNNQSVVIKVSNMYKSILFLGDLGVEASKDFVDHNLDEINCDAVQVAYHGQNSVDFETYKKISPKICFWPTSEKLWNSEYEPAENDILKARQWMETLKVKENYIAKDGDITVRIW